MTIVQGEDIVAMPPRFKPRHERIEGERL